MKVLLVQAAQLDREGRPVVAKTSRFDDLTLASLAALAPRGVECLPVMEKLGEVDFEVDVGLVAITAMGVSPMLRAYQIADRFRARGVPVVLGGTNFSLNAAEAKQHADAVVLGDADRVFARVIEDAARRRLEPFYQGESAGDLAGLPVPRYDLFSERPELRQALFTVQASRGCPHRCEYCAVGSLHEGRIRLRPVDEVIRDVQATGRRRIFFADDNLMANPGYYNQLRSARRAALEGGTTHASCEQPDLAREECAADRAAPEEVVRGVRRAHEPSHRPVPRRGGRRLESRGCPPSISAAQPERRRYRPRWRDRGTRRDGARHRGALAVLSCGALHGLRRE